MKTEQKKKNYEQKINHYFYLKIFISDLSADI